MEIYTLRNVHGCEARITNYGAILLSLNVPDRQGKMDDVVLGFDRPEDYLTPGYVRGCPYFGALVGRYANRIAQGTFTLDGHEYHLPTNNGANTLHGGKVGFDKRLWQSEGGHGGHADPGSTLKLAYTSADGEEGFPGKLQTTVVYTLADDNALTVDLTAETLDGKDTVINLTQHSYFNLRGAGQGDILGHEVTIKAAKFVPIDDASLPLGSLQPVAGTPFDFNRPTRIGARIHDPDEQLKHGMGYDHAFVLDDYASDAARLRLVVRVTEPTTGRVLELESDQPGVQFYTGNQLDGSLVGKGGRPYPRHGGFCLEPGAYPDTPNHPDFPSAVLRAGETYRHTIVYRFSVQP